MNQKKPVPLILNHFSTGENSGMPVVENTKASHLDSVCNNHMFFICCGRRYRQVRERGNKMQCRQRS